VAGGAFAKWLVSGAIGPAAFGLPVDWAIDELADVAKRWFKRIRRTDDLSRLVRAAAGTSVGLTRAEFDAVRHLLENTAMWHKLGSGTVEQLASDIAESLSDAGRTAADAQTVAMAIARGLLEFAVADLEPLLFQQLLVARLQRLNTDQAGALDQAMLHVMTGFDEVMSELGRVLDRLPPGPARRSEIVVYLQALVDWLNQDEWPQDQQFVPGEGRAEQPALTPASIERKLRITVQGVTGEDEADADADDLARHCRRLVILGGPGSGKTWLAKRTARRCAEVALGALAEGKALEEVELPLYTTCSFLSTATGALREAVASSAVNEIGDLGSSRLTATVRDFFADRNAPTLLVIDSLDEARGADHRLRQMHKLSWRIVLTSRRSSWNRQLHLQEREESERIGELQPLRYPDDVEPFINRWFDGRPTGDELAAQIARQPVLQQAVTVPLILAFYCLVAGEQQLPEFRHDLHATVVAHMLTGRWRGDAADSRRWPDIETCLETLRVWAWSGAVDDPVSGVGTWQDGILTSRVRLTDRDEDAVSHVAIPVTAPAVNTGKIRRRFIHRSVREYLVAQYVADLPKDEAVEVLLPHLWYDPDWEYVVPAALAMHPQHDELLGTLIRRTASSDTISDLAVIEAGWEMRELLARIAQESGETDWSPPVAAVIAQARVQLALAGRLGDLAGGVPWTTSDREVRRSLLARLASPAAHSEEESLVDCLVQLHPTPDDMRLARESLLTRLAEGHLGRLSGFARSLTQLDPTPEDTQRARQTLLARLPDLLSVKALAQLNPTPVDTRRARESLLAKMTSSPFVEIYPLESLMRLNPTPDDLRQAREALLTDLQGPFATVGDCEAARLLTQLDPTPDDLRRARIALLRWLADSWTAKYVGDTVVQLATATEDKRDAREILLAHITGDEIIPNADQLAGWLARLDPTVEEMRRARNGLFRQIARQAGGWTGTPLKDTAVQFAAAVGDIGRARAAMLRLLARQTRSSAIANLAGALVPLCATPGDQSEVRDVLLRLLTRQGSIQGGLEIRQFNPTEDETCQIRDALLGLADRETNSHEAVGLVQSVMGMDPLPDDMRRARKRLLVLLDGETGSGPAGDLARAVALLDPLPEDMRRARKRLLVLLDGETGSGPAGDLARAVALLDPLPEDMRRARKRLLVLLDGETRSGPALELARAMALLDPLPEETRRARDRLLGLLAECTKFSAARALAWAMEELDWTAEEKVKARERLLALVDRTWINRRELQQFAPSLVRFVTPGDDKRQIETLIAFLADAGGFAAARGVTEAMVQLATTTQQKREIREMLAGQLSRGKDRDLPSNFLGSPRTDRLVKALIRLDPTVQNLSSWRTWPVTPPDELLAAARRNSTLADWLAALASLPPLPSPTNQKVSGLARPPLRTGRTFPG
jgi:NACHT domain